uniref:Transmembrane channel-like protein n=1 Tax=Sinocyclocheilus grahami TaxID=75366 RepID=A0A672KGA6_SINGR
MLMFVHAAESWSSDLSRDSCEYYQTEIFGLLPSSQAHRRLHAETLTDDQDQSLLDRVSWNPSVPLRDLPVCLQDKRDIRERQPLQRRSIGHWDSWRRSQQKTRRRLKEHVGGAVSGLLPWRHTLHKIEGQFGVGVKAYFVFLRYLLCLNLLYCVIIGGSVLTPTLVFGVLESSPVFHSFYTRGSLDLDCLNTPILFLLGMFSVLFLSIIMVVRRTVVGYKHSWLTGNRFNSNLSYKVFCGWDFCIQNPQAASLKQNFVRNELRMDLEEQTFQQRVQQRSLRHWVQLIFLRILLNVLVLVLLGSSFILIYFAIQKSQTKNHWTLCLMLEYLPPITVTTVNYILPHVFSKISEFEDYSLTIQLNLTLIRSIFLKLASLGIYLFFFISGYQCTENAFGKEMYKLTIFNLLECFFNAFCVAYPRMLLVERFPSSKLAQLLGKKQFEISFNVLDLVNSQTVTWVGVFYCPLLPAINTIRLLSDPGGCGPFEGNRTVFNVTSVCIKTLPNPVQSTISYISSEAFAFALILAEVVILTSYVSRGRANRKAIERLKDMLVMVSVTSDKRFLVKQHSTIMRRQQRTR